MATQFSFDGKIVKIPGAYSRIIGGINSVPLALGFGNTLLIDTGSGKFFGGGAGVNGELDGDKDALYTFDNAGDFRLFKRGGLHWLLAEPLFNPGGGAQSGVDSVTTIKAATTVAARLDISFGTSTSDGDANDGSIELAIKDEGYAGNGVLGDETRAKATITVTNAGATGDVLSILIDGESAGSYVVEAGDNIAAVVAGLAAAIDANGFSEVFSQNATQIVIYAPHGYAADLNGLPATVTPTGTVAASSGNFSGGVEGTILTRGYAFKMIAGVNDGDKFIFQFYRGTFKGLDADGGPYDGILEINTRPQLIVKSPEVATVQELVTWMQSNSTFKFYFELIGYTIASTDEITSADLAFYTTYAKASGGTESYGSDDLVAVLYSIADETYDFILLDKWGSDARHANNLAIMDWILNTAKIRPDAFVGGGADSSEWNGSASSSVQLAEAFDSQNAILVHGDAKKISGVEFKERPSIFKAANVLGRIAGLAPQVPPTFKNIGINGEAHKLRDRDVELGLDSGVLMTKEYKGGFEIVKGINTLQNNTNLVNADGSTHSIQLGRIERQLNKELMVNLKDGLLKKPNGANRNTVKAEDVKTFVENYLETKTATDLVDNLIISYQSVSVTRNQDAYEITYVFTPNYEVSVLLSTGIIVDNA